MEEPVVAALLTEPASNTGVLEAGNLVLNLDSRCARLAGARLSLTHQEFEVLALLLRRTNVIVLHQDICRAIWGCTGPREVKRLGVVISNLREKLDHLSPYTISTVRSRGYGLVLTQGVSASLK
jgi:DNA-binding response OmpR family regulator